MKIRLHEIEIGSDDVKQSTNFFQRALGLTPLVQQKGLTVFDAGLQGLDLNVSNHLPKGTVCISFIADDLASVEERLTAAGIAYEGPLPSHLGMTTLQFKSPDGFFIKVNTTTLSSPVG